MVVGLWQMIKGGFVREQNLIIQLVAANMELNSTNAIGRRYNGCYEGLKTSNKAYTAL